VRVTLRHPAHAQSGWRDYTELMLLTVDERDQ
jgi:hypothetical protein